MKKLLILLLFITGFASADTSIYLVRHAEKIIAEGVNDPELTQMGLFRAQNIAKQLSSVGVTQIFSTEYQRTMQTAQPLADYQSIQITPYDASKPEEFAEKIKQIDGVVLVVGHSNTIPELTQLLSNKEVNAIEDNEYDNLYQVIITENQTILNRFKTIPSNALKAPSMRIKLRNNQNNIKITPVVEKSNENK